MSSTSDDGRVRRGGDTPTGPVPTDGSSAERRDEAPELVEVHDVDDPGPTTTSPSPALIAIRRADEAATPAADTDTADGDQAGRTVRAGPVGTDGAPSGAVAEGADRGAAGRRRRLRVPALPRRRLLVPVVLILVLGGAARAVLGGDAEAPAGVDAPADAGVAAAGSTQVRGAGGGGHAGPPEDHRAGATGTDQHAAPRRTVPASPVVSDPRVYDGTRSSSDPANRAGQPGWSRGYAVGRELVVEGRTCEQAAPLAVRAGLVPAAEQADFVEGCRARG